MLSDEEVNIAAQAKAFIVGMTDDLIEIYFGNKSPRNEGNCVSIFMAGSAGAGKTEYSTNFIRHNPLFSNTVRIDADEIRNMIPVYQEGKCSARVVTVACTKGVHILHDYAIKKGFDIILDGTFAEENMAMTNIARSLQHNRIVEIHFLFQDPLIAWGFTKDREKIERREVSRDFFINSVIGSRSSVDFVKKHFGNKIALHVILQDRTNNTARIWQNAESIDTTDIPKYSAKQLDSLI